MHDARAGLRAGCIRSFRRRRDQRKRGTMSKWRRAMDRVLDWTIGYGYRPGRSVIYLAVIALIVMILGVLGTLLYFFPFWHA